MKTQTPVAEVEDWDQCIIARFVHDLPEGTKLYTQIPTLLQYNTTDDPVEKGVYACRVPHASLEGWYEDEFLIWFNGRWGYIGSPERYRGKVAGWIGPLQRRMT